MLWQISNHAPIYAQLLEQLKAAVVSGAFPPGSRLPSVRDLAMEAGVNPNTMQRALAELERCGLVYSQRTSGRFVTEDAAAIATARTELARSRVETCVQSLTELGFDRECIAGLLARELGKE